VTAETPTTAKTTAKTLPAGFRWEPGSLLVNEGGTDTAAGVFGDSGAPALWTRQVLTTGRLRAVVITAPDDGPEPFQAVHAIAERTAASLGIGAVEVGVCATTATDVRHANRLTSGGWAVAGCATGSGLVLITTDAVVSTDDLRATLSAHWSSGETALILASGESGRTPGLAAFAATVAALRLDLVSPRGGAA
jgi:glutamate N-acetyltransferase / amino-acid N-acetyltransferase